ncbi:MAG: mechanosensitive ion channel domain-containing protein [Gemmatimonadota bacterium]
MYLALQASEPDGTGTADVSSPWLESIAGWAELYPILAMLIGLALVAVACVVALVAVQRYLLRIIARLTRATPTTWDEFLLNSKVLHRLSWLVPAFIAHQGVGLVPGLPAGLEGLVRRVVAAATILLLLRVMSAVLDLVTEVYNRLPAARDRPIKGFLQVVSIVFYCIGGILIVATLMDESPLVFFSGIGAMTAILMLVFRDSLLSLVAGIQLAANNLIRVGDWIEMPQFSADGDVVDIALNSVSVQNWDKTITVIPTHKFLEHSFKNWRGMEDSGGRRIKRAIHIDMGTVRFLSEEEVAHFGRFVLLRDYVAAKTPELDEYNRQHCTDPSVIANARRLTNLGMLRAYVWAYLRQHPMIRQDMTFLVRQLAPTAEGLPLEIYVFVRDIRWANYEAIQADIFDHIVTIFPEFGLRVYQRPAGSDLAGVSVQQPDRTREVPRVPIPSLAP